MIQTPEQAAQVKQYIKALKDLAEGNAALPEMERLPPAVEAQLWNERNSMRYSLQTWNMALKEKRRTLHPHR